MTILNCSCNLYARPASQQVDPHTCLTSCNLGLHSRYFEVDKLEKKRCQTDYKKAEAPLCQSWDTSGIS